MTKIISFLKFIFYTSTLFLILLSLFPLNYDSHQNTKVFFSVRIAFSNFYKSISSRVRTSVSKAISKKEQKDKIEQHNLE